uniref:Uncharacterized protein n=1 Tax=Zooxanthella nutricula TaxID=1333877 RepID=A0A6U6IUJ7_9DINO
MARVSVLLATVGVASCLNPLFAPLEDQEISLFLRDTESNATTTPPPLAANSTRGIASRMSSASEEAAYASALAKQAQSFAQEYRAAKAKAAQYASEVVEAAKVVRRASMDVVNASRVTADAVAVVDGEADFINGTNVTVTAIIAAEAARAARKAAEDVNRALASFRAAEEDARQAAAKAFSIAKVVDASINRTLQYSHAASEALETPMDAAAHIIAASTTLLSSTTTSTITPALLPQLVQVSDPVG